MDMQRFMKMDSIMALSWINTKLRDEFSSLEGLCEEFDFEIEKVIEKFRTINYEYNAEINKFI